MVSHPNDQIDRLWIHSQRPLDRSLNQDRGCPFPLLVACHNLKWLKNRELDIKKIVFMMIIMTPRTDKKI